MALATPADLTAYVAKNADLLLDQASELVEGYVTPQQFRLTTQTVVLDWSEPLWLLRRPVTAVVAVTDFDDSPLTGWQSQANAVYRIPQQNRPVKVTYTHGYATCPPDVQSVVLGMVARAQAGATGLVSESIGSYTYRAAGDGERLGVVALTDEDRRTLDRYRRRTASVRIR